MLIWGKKNAVWAVFHVLSERNWHCFMCFFILRVFKAKILRISGEMSVNTVPGKKTEKAQMPVHQETNANFWLSQHKKPGSAEIRQKKLQKIDENGCHFKIQDFFLTPTDTPKIMAKWQCRARDSRSIDGILPGEILAVFPRALEP